jgi:glycosyltransferase involved in cell wall biosynthesis
MSYHRRLESVATAPRHDSSTNEAGTVIDQVTQRIVLFNLYSGGHNPQHLECLAAYWGALTPDAELHVVVSDRHFLAHADTAARLAETPNTELHVARLPDGFDEPRSGTFARDRLHGRLAAHYIKLLHPDHFVLMFFDHAQLSLAAGLRFRWPLAISGIYFKPSFHYGSLSGPAQTRKDRAKGVLKQLVLRAALRNPHLRTIFSLDPFAVPYIERWSTHTEAVALPEPLEDKRPAVGHSLLDDLEPGRRRLVIFGSLDARKGIGVVLDALQALPRQAQRELTLVLAGPVTGPGRVELLTRLREFDADSNVELILEDSFIPESDVQRLLAGCDLSLLTYQRPVGSSGVLIRAAAAGIPVLSTDYGVVGEQVRRHRLGITVDTTDANAIRDVIESWIEQPETIPFDPEAAAEFARQNTAELFAATIFGRLLRPDED